MANNFVDRVFRETNFCGIFFHMTLKPEFNLLKIPKIG